MENVFRGVYLGYEYFRYDFSVFELAIIVPLLILILGAIILLSKKLNKEDKQEEKKQHEAPDTTQYYQSRGRFFSKTEYVFFSELEKQNNGKYHIFSKVRLEDIVQVNPKLNWRTRNNKRKSIRSRHIDFVLVDKDSGEVVKAIELDGYSHNGDKQKDSNNKKDHICEQVGIELIRVQVGDDFEKNIANLYS